MRLDGIGWKCHWFGLPAGTDQSRSHSVPNPDGSGFQPEFQLLPNSMTNQPLNHFWPHDIINFPSWHWDLTWPQFSYKCNTAVLTYARIQTPTENINQILDNNDYFDPKKRILVVVGSIQLVIRSNSQNKSCLAEDLTGWLTCCFDILWLAHGLMPEAANLQKLSTKTPKQTPTKSLRITIILIWKKGY